ncbi:uncharacterized protein LOC135845793 [Planococcus citri]|uniref:uncharacterized protein LOC135845793 n=1 Tax=Planococcus citri TaxID=170843 RepID=UPI0031F9F73F
MQIWEMKLLLSLLISLKIDNKLLICINAERTTLGNSNSFENTTKVPCSQITIHSLILNTQNVTSIEKPSTDTAANITSSEVEFLNNTSAIAQQTSTQATLASESQITVIGTGNLTTGLDSATDIAECHHTKCMLKQSIAITSAVEIAQKPTTTPIPIFTQQNTTGLTQNPQAEEIAQKPTTTPIPISIQQNTAGLTQNPQPVEISQKTTSTPIPISTQQKTARLTPKPNHQTKKTNQTRRTPLKITPFRNTTAKVTRPKLEMRKASNFTVFVKTPPTTNTPSRKTYTFSRYNWSISITQPTTKEIDFRESIEFGEESFKKFMFRTAAFVDKSLMIKEFLEHDKQVILITRPVLWGKSLNLNMLRKFFEIEVDDQGNILPEENRVNRKIFCGGQVYVNDSLVKSFQPLKISNFSSPMKYQGKHPVVQLNYHFIQNGNFEEVKAIMTYEVIKSYKRHFYLDSYFKKNPQFLDESEKSQLERYSKGNLTESDLVNSLCFLSHLLYKYFNETVFILIDEYDTPLRGAFLHSSDNPDNLEKVLKFYRELYTAAFKNNPCLAKGFLTGKLRISNSNLFVNLDNVAEYTLLDHEFSQFYGFTEQEVDQLVGPSLGTELLHQMKAYYKGYNYGGQMMYNPWSIKQCIENDYKIEHYWLGSQLLFPVHRQSFSLDHIEPDVRSLLEGGCVEIPIRNEVSFDNLTDRRNFFNFILFTGYLSPGVKYPNGTYQLVKPNTESMLYYEIVLHGWLKPTTWGLHFSKSKNLANVSSFSEEMNS